MYKFHYGLIGQSSEGWISNDFIVDDNEISRIPNWYYEYCSLESKINKLYFINCNTENNPSKYSYEFIEEIINYKSSLILHQKKYFLFQVALAQK